MKFQNRILINFEQTHGRTDGRNDGQAKSNMPLQLFQSWGHKTVFIVWNKRTKLKDFKNAPPA